MKQNQSYPGRSILSAMGAIGTTIFALPFVGGEILGTGMLIHALGIMVALLLVSGIAFSLLFHHLLKAPTPAGQRLLDRIKGFRLYLSVAEANDLKMTYSPRLDNTDVRDLSALRHGFGRRVRLVAPF